LLNEINLEKASFNSKLIYKMLIILLGCFDIQQRSQKFFINSNIKVFNSSHITIRLEVKNYRTTVKGELGDARRKIKV